MLSAQGPSTFGLKTTFSLEESTTNELYRCQGLLNLAASVGELLTLVLTNVGIAPWIQLAEPDCGGDEHPPSFNVAA